MDPVEQVMKKCTLCVDRIYNENLPEEDRVPACVRTCPTGARAFGDLGDPESEVSEMVRERGGFDLMPEQGTAPVNKYLPPRQKQHLIASATQATETQAKSQAPDVDGFWGWVDSALAKLG
tara:strand:- start:439 stop:801 length:363 start_codon:yes stop_codon:yes gene_type:complete